MPDQLPRDGVEIVVSAERCLHGNMSVTKSVVILRGCTRQHIYAKHTSTAPVLLQARPLPDGLKAQPYVTNICTVANCSNYLIIQADFEQMHVYTT